MRVAISVGLLLVVSINGTGGETAASSAMEIFGPQRDWPRFRGPAGNGLTAEKGLPTKWSRTENVAWAVDVFQPKPCYPFYPYASPIVFKDKVFITVAYYKESIFEDPPKNLKLKVPRPKTFAEMAEFKLVCFNKSDGKRLWETSLGEGAGWAAGPFPQDHGDECSVVASTPCTDGERVYVAFGQALLVAVDYNGKLLWRQDIGKLVKSGFDYSLGTSPTIYKNLVMMVLTVRGQGCTVAFDGKTGELKYQVPRPNQGWGSHPGFPSPVPALCQGRPFMLTNGSSSTIDGINPEDGKVAWFCKIKSQFSSLAVGDGIVFAHDGEDINDGNRGAVGVPYWAVAYGLDNLGEARGDVTQNAKWKTDYRIKNVYNGNWGFSWSGSPVVANGCAYVVGPVEHQGKPEAGQAACLHCFEAATGKELYAEKIGPSVPFPFSQYSSPFATADGIVYFVSSGRSTVIRTGPKFELISTNDTGDGEFEPAQSHSYRTGGSGHNYSYALNSPAVSDGKIFILGCNKLWCIGK